MKECSKSISRRLHQANFLSKYFVGHGVDIGGKPDPLALYTELFPLMRSVRTWDLEDGDAQYMDGVPDNHFDFVHSSHCLEHMREPAEALHSWLRVVKPNGHLIITVPDQDLYEQGVFPSSFNRDHKWTFTIGKTRSWNDKSLNLLELLANLGEAAAVLKVELLDSTFRYNLPRFDQTLTPVAECGIEFIVRKRSPEEIAAGGRLPRADADPGREMRIHFNQYRDDMKAMKTRNTDRPPFTNDDPI